MTKLIDREAAVRILDERAEQAYAEARSYCDPVKRDKWDLQLSMLIDGRGQGLEAAMDILRARPAIGTCATCAEWGANAEAVIGICRSEKYVRATPLQTWPHHFCADWKRRDP